MKKRSQYFNASAFTENETEISCSSFLIQELKKGDLFVTPLLKNHLEKLLHIPLSIILFLCIELF